MCVRERECVRVCGCPREGNVKFNATPNNFLLNKICLNQESWIFLMLFHI